MVTAQWTQPQDLGTAAYGTGIDSTSDRHRLPYIPACQGMPDAGPSGTSPLPLPDPIP